MGLLAETLDADEKSIKEHYAGKGVDGDVFRCMEMAIEHMRFYRDCPIDEYCDLQFSFRRCM